MKILITGATGFIGSRLALRCLADGHTVRALGRENNEIELDNARMLRERGAEVVVASVTDPAALRSALDGIDRVFHLAAAQHEANVPDRHFHDVNVEGTRLMLEAGAAAGVGRFVHGSSIGVYGQTSNGTPVTDDSDLDPDNIYGLTKLAGEEMVRSYSGRLDWVIVRISEVYGPGDRRLLKLFRGVAKGRFPVIGRGENLHHLVYIDDLIDGLLLSAERPEAVGRTFVMAGERALTTREMLEGVAAQLGTSPPKLYLPLGPMMLAARVLEGVMRPVGIQPPIHPRRMNFFVKTFSFTCAEARSTIGYAPSVDFQRGIAETARWYDEQGLL